MISFQPVRKRDAAKLRRYYENCDYVLCDYSLGTKIMWRGAFKFTWAEVAGCLVICAQYQEGVRSFDYPVAGPDGDEDAALCAIEKHCMETGIPPRIMVVPENKTAYLLSRYPYVHVNHMRSLSDYIYYQEDLKYFTGRRYSGQRNHIKKFYKLCPDAVFRVLGKDKSDMDLITRFWSDYEAEFPKGDNKGASAELKYAKDMLKMAGRSWFYTGGLFDGEKLLGLSMAEKCGETLIIHIEKALYSYTGVYPALVQSFAAEFGGNCKYIDREDDAADKGLRASKIQYGPAKMGSKYYFEPQNEILRHVDAIPELKTSRLILSKLREDDIPAYNNLILDEERNKWWGYDDILGLKGPVTERGFYEVAERDFKNRLAVNFAVRLDGKFIGEAVLYNFDYRGGAELGCRIDKAYAGNGYGTEAFAAVAEWGLYQVYLSRIKAKCFHENQASYKMLSSCMRRCGEDDIFYYFEKLV